MYSAVIGERIADSRHLEQDARLTEERLSHIETDHPEMKGQVPKIVETVSDPTESFALEPISKSKCSINTIPRLR